MGGPDRAGWPPTGYNDPVQKGRRLAPAVGQPVDVDHHSCVAGHEIAEMRYNSADEKQPEAMTTTRW
jgi:hypothetical protein